MTRLVRALSVTLIGLLAGAMLEEYFVISRVLAHLSGDQFARAHAQFGTFHPFTVIPLALVGGLATVLVPVLDRQQNSVAKVLSWLGVATAAVCAVVTMAVMFPMNGEIVTWAEKGAPSDWAEIRDRWAFWQAVRAIFSVSGFAAIAGAALLARR